MQLPLADFLRKYPPVYGDSWENALKDLQDDPFENYTINSLIARYINNLDVDPVCITKEAECEGLYNGMHRVCAHILLQKETIDFVVNPEQKDENLWWVSFTAQHSFVDDGDPVWQALRSFPAGDGWMESDIGACTGDVFEEGYYLRKVAASDVEKYFKEAASHWGIHVQILSSKFQTVSERWPD